MPELKQLMNLANPMNLKRTNRMKNFRAHILICIEKRNYIVKTADTTEELREALRLRHEIFYQELLHRKKRSGIDHDRFDKNCDHLIIIDKRSGKIIGTYRLQSSLHTRKWYTATEFHMRHIKQLPGNKLELGRACVHPDYRNGVTIALLWEGISAYMDASESSYLFGCSSIKTLDRDEIHEIYHYLKHHGHVNEEHRVRPKSKFKVPGFKKTQHTRNQGHQLYDSSLTRDKIPSLLTSYLRIGAKVCGDPALDKSFKCIDFLTLVHVQDIQKSYSRKFRGE